MPLILRLSSGKTALLLAVALGLGCAAQQNEAKGRDVHGPALSQLQAYMNAMESPGRVQKQQPEKVVEMLQLRATDTVADIGCGPGFFTRYLAHAVPNGQVYAVDIEPLQLDRLNQHLAQEQIVNVVPVLAVPDDPRVPPHSLYVAFISDAYHHLDNRVHYLTLLKDR